MAKLYPETLTCIFNLLRQIAEEIEIAGATEWILFETYGENPRTINELDELQNIKERLNQSYSRLNTLTLSAIAALVGWVKERNPTNSLLLQCYGLFYAVICLLLGCTTFNPTYVYLL